jgi:hypothetical protein
VSDCVACTGEVADGYILCLICGDQIADGLADVGGLLPSQQPGKPRLMLDALTTELGTTTSRQDRIVINPGRGGETGLPWKDAAADAFAELDHAVHHWAAQVNHAGDPMPADVPAAARWLWRRVDWLRAHPDAKEAHRQITTAVARAERVIDLPANRARFEVGPCPEIVEDCGHCTGVVWAYIATRPEDESVLRCWDCGARWNTTQWLRVGRRILTRSRQIKRRAA